jgi:uncharacterized ubiquitin-like protein YukD
MKEFTSKKIDLDIDLTTINNEQVELRYAGKLTAKESLNIVEKFTELETSDMKNGIERFMTVCKELNFLYPAYKAEWFLDNVDPETLQDMIRYISQGLAGLKKRE